MPNTRSDLQSCCTYRERMECNEKFRSQSRHCQKDMVCTCWIPSKVSKPVADTVHMTRVTLHLSLYHTCPPRIARIHRTQFYLQIDPVRTVCTALDKRRDHCCIQGDTPSRRIAGKTEALDFHNLADNHTSWTWYLSHHKHMHWQSSGEAHQVVSPFY